MKESASLPRRRNPQAAYCRVLPEGRRGGRCLRILMRTGSRSSASRRGSRLRQADDDDGILGIASGPISPAVEQAMCRARKMPTDRRRQLKRVGRAAAKIIRSATGRARVRGGEASAASQSTSGHSAQARRWRSPRDPLGQANSRSAGSVPERS